MPGLRDHRAFIIEYFNGLWDRGDDESCPSDHFLVADNVQYFESGVETRNPLMKWQVTTGIPLVDIIRIHNYVMQDGQSLLVLVKGGSIYHMIGPNVIHGPILTIAAMTDFNTVSIAGRAYITPFHSLIDATGQTYELGLANDFIYVYLGDGVAARRAGGLTPSNGGLRPFIAFNDLTDGKVTRGIHEITVIFNSGYQPTIVPKVDAPGDRKIQVTGITIGPVGTTSRTIVMTKAIQPEDISIPASHDFFPVLVINDNTTTDAKIDIADADMITPIALGTPFLYETPMQGSSYDPGYSDTGFHLFGVVYETNTGFLSSPGPEYFGGNTWIDMRRGIRFFYIPTSSSPTVIKRHLVSTKAIPNYNGDQKGYQFFFIPGGTIEDNTTVIKDVSYFDSDLIQDASHLIDNFDFIPAGVNLTTYHSRMVVSGIGTTPDPAVLRRSARVSVRTDNRSVALVSAAGEPEAISKVDGLIIAPLDGSPLTHAQEFRDILYLFKKTRTYGYSDNFDEPASWQEEVIDQGIGSPVHGIATVLDSGGVNIDFLVIADWSGLMLFNGTYSRPELSFKIEDFWGALDRNKFSSVQIANDSISKKIYITLPEPFRYYILYADYSNGLDPKNIRWSRWVFDGKIMSLCLVESNKLIVGADTIG